MYLGARGAFYLNIPTGGAYPVAFPFSGSIDELRIYSGSLTQAQITSLYNNPPNTPYVGNVFYQHGLVVITNKSGSYSNLMLGTGGDGFTLNCKGTKRIQEHDVVLTAKASELNMSLNPSLQSGLYGEFFDPVVTTSAWTPYITTVGLYNDNAELLAVAKFAKPVKKVTDVPLTFAIRWDV
jgi:hypothetical protein